MTLGEKLRELRKLQELTLKDLSERTELSVSYLSDIERDRTSPSLDTLRTLSSSFGMTVADLLADVDWAGGLTLARLPPGLQELKADSNYDEQLTEEWLESLVKIEWRGKRPETKQDWLEIFLHLRRILE